MLNILRRGLSSPYVQAGIVGLACLALYVITLAPGLMYTDSGELAAACTTFGVAHPTGYPLFTLIGHCWTLLPWSSAVFGLNVLAAVWVSAAIAGIYLVLIQLSVKPAVALVASLLAAVSSTIWSQATSIEVYSLHLALLVWTLYSALRARQPGPSAVRSTAITGLLYGLMLANHLSSVFLAPGLILLWLSGPIRFRDRIQLWPYAVVPALLGVALYAVLPLRSAQEPLINWGMVHRSVEAFLYHVKGTQFGVWLFTDKKVVAENAAILRGILTSMFLWIGLVPVLVGMWRILRAERKLFFSLSVLIIGNLGIALGYAIPDISSYFLPTIVVATMFFAVGLNYLAQRVNKNLHYSMLLFPIVCGIMQWPMQDLRDHRAVPSYTEWVFANAEPDAIILTRQWDYFCSAAWYMQTVENKRTDVAIIDKELLRRTWYAPWLKQRYPEVMKNVENEVSAFMPYLSLFENNATVFNRSSSNVRAIQERFVNLLNALLINNPTRPIYVTPELVGNDEPGFAPGYRPVPAGPLVRLVRDSLYRNTNADDSALPQIILSLEGRKERLDSGLRQTVMSNLATMAFYSLDALGDTSAYRRYRIMARRLDSRSPITARLPEL